MRVKVLYGDNGKLNSRGEFASMTALHAASTSKLYSQASITISLIIFLLSS